MIEGESRFVQVRKLDLNEFRAEGLQAQSLWSRTVYVCLPVCLCGVRGGSDHTEVRPLRAAGNVFAAAEDRKPLSWIGLWKQIQDQIIRVFD